MSVVSRSLYAARRIASDMTLPLFWRLSMSSTRKAKYFAWSTTSDCCAEVRDSGVMVVEPLV